METSLPQSIDEYWQVFVKRKFHFLIPFTVTAVLVAAAYPFLPKYYKATASIMIDEDEIVALKSSGKRGKGPDVEKRLRSVYIEMMEPENIQELATLMGRSESETKDPKALRRWGSWMRRGMEVNEQPGGVIDISFSHQDPYMAQKSANSLAQLMVWLDKKGRVDDAEKSIKFIEQQLHLYKSRIQDSQKSFFVNKVSGDLEESMRKRSAVLDQIDQFEKSSPAIAREQSPAVYKLQSELTETRTRLSQLSVTAREDSPMVRDLRTRVAELETAIAKEKEATPEVAPNPGANGNPAYANLLHSLRDVNNEITYLRRRQNNLEQGVAYVSEEEMDAKSREQHVNEDIYQDLLQNLESAQMQLRLASYGEGGAVRVLEESEKPVMPAWPLPWQAAGIGIFLALAAGIGTVLVREMSDTSLRGTEDAQRSFKLPILATIPDLYPVKSGMEAAIDTSSPQLVALHNPQSLAAEHYRLLRTRILFMTQKRPIQSLLFTSSLAGEGKTTTSCNMAISMANELDKRIVLVDCDLRQSAVGRYLALPEKKGLHEYLADQASLDSILKPTRLERLTVITGGEPMANPSKLLASPRMADLLRDLRERFDFIILDAAPLVPLADVPILLAHADALALVAHVGKTPKKFIRQAISTIENAQRAPLLGLVLTRAENTLPTYVNQYFVSGSGHRTKR